MRHRLWRRPTGAAPAVVLEESRQQVSDAGHLLEVVTLSERGDQIQHLLVRRDICFGDHLHHLRHTEQTHMTTDLACCLFHFSVLPDLVPVNI